MRPCLNCALAAAVLLSSAASAQQPAIAQLYPAAPPPGSAFVRVVNPQGFPARISMAGVEEKQPISVPANIATHYRIVNPSRPLQILVNARPVPITIQPDSFTTLVLRQTGGDYSLVALNDITRGHNALKADLRFYNLVPGCLATVMAEQALKVFDDVPENETRRRAINPVAVPLNGLCGKTSSLPWTLPPLQPGARYSLFLTGDPLKPVLTGKIDVVE